jgi:beta-N-acetylhexosaminidase
MRLRRGWVVALVVCAAGVPAPAHAAAQPSPAQRIFAAMTERERIGQLLMVGTPSTGVSAATRHAIRKYHVGAVILDGTTDDGASAVQQVTTELQNLAPPGVGLFVATDQEGGYVQRLQGPGFSHIPTALDQGRLAAHVLRHDTRRWGRQLLDAGVNVDLAPVLDTVPPHFGSNPPIGDLDREFGHTTQRVSVHGVAALRGLRDAGIAATAKHFPGLGRVRGNTDTESGVTDHATGPHDRYLAPFRAAVGAHVPFMMVSTAIYTQIDPGRPAAFSRPIVTGMLRQDLQFQGLIISDDLGAAAQVSAVPVAERAVEFVAAGGDVILTVDASQAQAMTAALLQRARAVPAFKSKVDAAALSVLEGKQAQGLLS